MRALKATPWAASTAKGEAMLWTGPLKLKPDRSRKPDPEQKRHHPVPIHTWMDSGAVGSNQLKKRKGKQRQKKKKLKTQNWKATPQVAGQHNVVLHTGLTRVLQESTAGPDRVTRGLVLPGDGRDWGHHTSSKKGLCPLSTEDKNIYRPIWNTFTTVRSATDRN